MRKRSQNPELGKTRRKRFSGSRKRRERHKRIAVFPETRLLVDVSRGVFDAADEIRNGLTRAFMAEAFSGSASVGKSRGTDDRNH